MTTSGRKRSRYDLEGGATVAERFQRLGHGLMDFMSVWESLAEQGVVPAVIKVTGVDGVAHVNEADPALGVYRRLLQEWKDAGYPEAIGNFIRARVRAGASD